MRLIYTSLFLVLSVLVLSGVFFSTAHAHSGEVFHNTIEKENVEVAQSTQETKIAQLPNDSYSGDDESRLITGSPVCAGTGANRYCFFLPGPARSWGWESYRNRNRGSNTSWQHLAFDIYEEYAEWRIHRNPGKASGTGFANTYSTKYDTGVFALYGGTITGARYPNPANVTCGGWVEVEYNNVFFDGKRTTITQRLCHMQPKVHVKQNGSLINASDITTSGRNSEQYNLVGINNIAGKRVQAGDLIGYVGATGNPSSDSNAFYHQSHLHTDFNYSGGPSNNCEQDPCNPQATDDNPNDPYNYSGGYQLREGDLLSLNAIALGNMVGYNWVIETYCSDNIDCCTIQNNSNCRKELRDVPGDIKLTVDVCYSPIRGDSNSCTSGSTPGTPTPDPPSGEDGPTPGTGDPPPGEDGPTPGEGDPPPGEDGPTPGEGDPTPPGEDGPEVYQPPQRFNPPRFYDQYDSAPVALGHPFHHLTFTPGEDPELEKGTFSLNLEVDWPSIPGIGTLNDLVSDGLTLNELIVFVYTFLLWLSIILAFLALIYAGFLYVVSGANPSARSRAFDYVKRIVTGGTILLLTVLILSFINTDLVEIEEGITGITDAEIKALNDAVCSAPKNPEHANACLSSLPQQTRGSSVDYNYIGNNYAFIDYNKTLITNLSDNFVGTEKDVFGEKGGLNLGHSVSATLRPTLEEVVNENTLIQRIDELLPGGEYDINKCENPGNVEDQLEALKTCLTTNCSSIGKRDYLNLDDTRYSSFALDLYKLTLHRPFRDEENKDNVKSVSYQLGFLGYNDVDFGDRAKYLDKKLFDEDTDEEDNGYLYTGLLTLTQARDLVGEGGLASVNPVSIDVYQSLDKYSAITDDLQKKNDELADKYEELRQDQGIERREIGECGSDLCIEIQELDNEASVLQGQLDQVDNLQNSSPQNYNHAEDFFFTIESTLDINNPGGRFDESQSQRLWLWVHIPATEILDILENIAGAADPEEKCGVSRKACEEGECKDEQKIDQSKCVYGIVENTLKNALPNNCATTDNPDDVDGQDALNKLNELKALKDFKRMRNELIEQMDRVKGAAQYRSEWVHIHTCDSLKVYFKRLEGLQNSNDKDIYEKDKYCKAQEIAVGGLKVDVEGEGEQELTYEQQLDYLVCCPPENKILDDGNNKDRSIEKIIENSCGGLDVVFCSLPSSSQ